MPRPDGMCAHLRMATLLDHLHLSGGAATGFTAVLTGSTYATNIITWGAQVEQAAAPGPYVSTIGTARPSVSGGAAR